jgi:hypothetical protein
MTQVFKIVNAGSGAIAFLGSLVLINLLLVGYLLLQVRQGHSLIVLGLAICTVCIIAALFFWFAVGQSHSRLVVSDQSLLLKIPVYGRTIPRSELVPTQIEPIHMHRDSRFKLTWRLNGLSVPGYNIGWFQTKGSGKVLAVITTDEVLAIPTTNGYSLLISVKDQLGLQKSLS